MYFNLFIHLVLDADNDEKDDAKPEGGRMDFMKDALEQAMKDVQNEEEILKKRGFSRQELKEALKKFKAEKDDVQTPLVSV